MRYLVGILIVVILAGCTSGSSGIQPLSLQDTSKMGEKEYIITLYSYPEKPTGGKAFSLKIELQDAQTKEPVKHLSYELEIRDGSDKNVFWDSRHAMEGAPYVQKITLKSGVYTLKVAVDHGMGDKIMRLYEKEFKFKVS